MKRNDFRQMNANELSLNTKPKKRNSQFRLRFQSLMGVNLLVLGERASSPTILQMMDTSSTEQPTEVCDSSSALTFADLSFIRSAQSDTCRCQPKMLREARNCCRFYTAITLFALGCCQTHLAQMSQEPTCAFGNNKTQRCRNKGENLECTKNKKRNKQKK